MSVPESTAALGPHFAVDTHPAAAVADRPWQPLGDLLGRPGVLRGWVREIRGLLAVAAGVPEGRVDPRAAASLAHLGLVARLVAPALAEAAHTGRLLDLSLATTWWQPVPGRPLPLSVMAETALYPARRASGHLLAELVVEGPVRKLTTAVAELNVPPRVLWGNVASAVHGAAQVLTTALPHRAPVVRELSTTLLRSGALAGTGSVAAGRFRRRSCCLLYRAVPRQPGPVCADCVHGTS
ncbi:hypothetical protein ACFWQL_31600 [Amycolatopsis thermoflava]|uniref:hypothetical protein n=1 Tax=Amycolatopsis thermoflava TaxID=84480 RepID=UPI00364DD4E7